MRFLLTFLAAVRIVAALPTSQVPLLHHANDNRAVSAELFADLEQLARIVDISYCVGLTGMGISQPFQCLSRCSDFPSFELITTWNTGQLMSDSCGYIAYDHSPISPRIIVAFRGTYSIANTVVDLSTVKQEYTPYPGEEEGDAPRCNNCTVHSGFSKSWNVTSDKIVPYIQAAIATHPGYQLILVGHSLGGAVAALAGLDFISRGWKPFVTTFGEPRLGNRALQQYIDERFNIPSGNSSLVGGQEGSDALSDMSLPYRRVTHIDDPVPLLPLSEWGYRMHAGEIYITKASLSPDIGDLRLCSGDEDTECIAGQDASLASADPALRRRTSEDEDIEAMSLQEAVEKSKLADRAGSSWGIPARYKLWQLFFAHRDYFWRLGLCVPGGDPWDWGRDKYSHTSGEL